jgi:hypothetical protein
MKRFLLSALVCVSVASSSVAADGKLRGTGGISNIDGAAGGGISTWAVIGGYGEDDQTSFSANAAIIKLDDYTLKTAAINVGLANRLELSAARQRFELPGDAALGQNIFGAKLKLAGDLVYGDVPQISIGLQHRNNTSDALLNSLSIRDHSGLDVYLSVSRLFLSGPFDRSWLVSGSLRSTRAQQNGLLGFSEDRSLEPELAVAMLFNPKLALGAEFRAKPNENDALREDNWRTVFLAYFPNKRFSATAAYVDLGEIAARTGQSGMYLNVNVYF